LRKKDFLSQALDEFVSNSKRKHRPKLLLLIKKTILPFQK
jgi:hypothetical protein